MRRESGFTLIELVVVIGILGILATTAVPAFRTWQQRAHGSEASIMMKQIMDGQIMYYLERDTFFPAIGSQIIIPGHGQLTAQEQQWVDQIKDALNVTIPVGHRLDYFIENRDLGNGENFCQVEISATFPLFKNGDQKLSGFLNKDGQLILATGG